MKIHIYTDIANLFGQACRVWMDVLLDAGHEAELVDIGMGNELPLPDVGRSDVNVFIAGIYAFARLKTWGMPTYGKNVMWMLDPLTEQENSTMHRHKAIAFDAIAEQFDAVIAMDLSISNYLQLHHPKIPTLQIPYLLAERHITPPLAEEARTGQVIFFGGVSPQRLAAQKTFDAGGVPTEFVWASVWGKERDAKRRKSRINLNLHAEQVHTYFDQFRSFEAWAAGTPAVAEASKDLPAGGITPGIHIVMAELADLPQICAELLADAPRRLQISLAAQDLLRAQFSPARWRKEMLSVLQNLA